ncbi:uncharacterized protein At1g43920, Chloroplastic-like [Raphanus sativus]|uniref:Uncharacterized protein At1g43920, Chloroplastic-like n=1 Tax=Raphanus sativus TaxID=3726 RepID=A0A9W3CT34_RAPSA|nr:uncharacterized protein At1g43920, Chloroplastic-like [Raphanus sativus]
MSSVNSSSYSTDRLDRQHGIPTRCKCGEKVGRFTSKTVKNLGRLFHCCPMGSEMDKTHLFKWTDESVIEEVEDFQELFDVLLVDTSEIQRSMQACETRLKCHESRIVEMEDVVSRCQEKTIKCISELRILKALFLCCLVMIFIYFNYA